MRLLPHRSTLTIQRHTKRFPQAYPNYRRSRINRRPLIYSHSLHEASRATVPLSSLSANLPRTPNSILTLHLHRIRRTLIRRARISARNSQTQCLTNRPRTRFPKRIYPTRPLKHNSRNLTKGTINRGHNATSAPKLRRDSPNSRLYNRRHNLMTTKATASSSSQLKRRQFAQSSKYT